MKILLSIIIPTKNRYNTLLPLLGYLSSIEFSAYEIVIQDNSDNNSEVIDYLEKEIESKVSYFYSKENLSVIENSDLAVLNSKGEYVCFIGDDDGVMPYIIDVVKWMKINKVDVIKSYKPKYTWPGLQSNILDSNKSGVLKFEERTYKIKNVNLERALNYTLKRGGSSIDELPCLYHGIVERKTLDKIYEKTQTFFPGPSPDMANAIALCFFAENFKQLDFPVVISGKSSGSTGAQGVLHKHVARIEDVKHLPIKTKENWDNRIPKYWTGPTIWAQSVIDALNACGYSNKIEDFNFKYLYAKLIIFNFKQRKQLFKEFSFNFFNIKFIYFSFRLFINRVYIFINNRSGINKVIRKNNIKNIGEAIKVLDLNTKKEKMFKKQIIN